MTDLMAGARYPLRRLTYVAEIRLGKMLQSAPTSESDVEVRYLRAGHLEAFPGELPTMWASPLDLSRYTVEAGDLVVAEGGDVGRPEFVPTDAGGALIQNSLHRLRIRGEGDRRYLRYALVAIHGSDWLDVFCNRSTFGHLTVEKLSSLRVPIPTPPEQRAIADFLDTETARIDALIAKKWLLERAIREREEAHIEETLRMHGGVELPLRRLLAEPPAYGAAQTGVEGPDHWPRYIRITDLDDEGELRSNQVLRLPPEVARPYLLREGDLLLARSGATVGKAYLHGGSDGPAAFAGYLIRFRADSKRLLPELFRAWTSTSHYWSQVRLASLQATIENVSAEKYKDFSVPVPPRNKQPAIVATIHERLARSKSVRERLTRQLLLLQEHRQALITAAVTGKLEVPGVAA